MFSYFRCSIGSLPQGKQSEYLGSDVKFEKNMLGVSRKRYQSFARFHEASVSKFGRVAIANLSKTDGWGGYELVTARIRKRHQTFLQRLYRFDSFSAQGEN